MRPTDVRILHPDGSYTLCELAPAGTDPDGTQMWRILTPVGLGDTIYAAVLPAHTGLEYQWKEGR